LRVDGEILLLASVEADNNVVDETVEDSVAVGKSVVGSNVIVGSSMVVVVGKGVAKSVGVAVGLEVGESEVGAVVVDRRVGASVGWDVGSFVPIGLIGKHIK